MSGNPKGDACKTYLEQTKLLVTLSSAFIIAPAFFSEKVNVFSCLSICMEICFILSVFVGYIVFGTISGTQHKGDYNVYNFGTRLFSFIQIGLFIIGLSLLIVNISLSMKSADRNQPDQSDISPYQKGTTVRLNNIYFDFSEWTLRPESYYELSKLKDTLKKYPTLELRIQAHTDNIGSERFNKALSEKRAASVVQYLISIGIPSAQLSSCGFGESMPIATNVTNEGRMINRRVEFEVLR